MLLIFSLLRINNNMIFEHWIYSTAIAIIFGMIYYKLTKRDYPWIIIASAYAPDIDFIASTLLKGAGMNVLINGNPIRHGDCHNIAFLLLYAIFVALLLDTIGIKFRDSFIFASVGFCAHLFEDALVFNPAYPLLWPLSTQEFGIGIIDYAPDLYGIADSRVLITGIIAVILCAIIRTAYEGNGWLTRMFGCRSSQQA